MIMVLFTILMLNMSSLQWLISLLIGLDSAIYFFDCNVSYYL